MALVSDYISPGMFGVVCTDCVPIIPQEFNAEDGQKDWAVLHRSTGHTNIILVNGPTNVIVVEASE